MNAENHRRVEPPERIEQVLGISFFNGTVEEAVERGRSGGLIVAPSGTCFERFVRDAAYRRAILSADVVLPDSGLMVSLWRLLQRRRMQRISGLTYLKRLVFDPAFRTSDVLWILPNERSREKLLAWGRQSDHAISPNECYVAPMYGNDVRDEALLRLIEQRGPLQIVIGVGAGPQEKLGLFLRENLPLRPSIHCIGGALGFITGDQVAIPDWADKFYLGWLLRLLSQPRVFLPRLWRGRILPWWIWKYGSAMPPHS